MNFCRFTSWKGWFTAELDLTPEIRRQRDRVPQIFSLQCRTGCSFCFSHSLRHLGITTWLAHLPPLGTYTEKTSRASMNPHSLQAMKVFGTSTDPGDKKISSLHRLNIRDLGRKICQLLVFFFPFEFFLLHFLTF